MLRGSNQWLMETMRIGHWEVEIDVAATQQAYAQVNRGGPACCLCNGCRNFTILGEAAYPDEFRNWLYQAGIDWKKPIEVSKIELGKKDWFLYEGWFHAIGRLVSGPAIPSDEPMVDRLPTFSYNEKTFKIIVIEQKALAFDPFKNRPLIQIDFWAELPWELDKREPKLVTFYYDVKLSIKWKFSILKSKLKRIMKKKPAQKN